MEPAANHREKDTADSEVEKVKVIVENNLGIDAREQYSIPIPIPTPRPINCNNSNFHEAGFLSLLNTYGRTIPAPRELLAVSGFLSSYA